MYTRIPQLQELNQIGDQRKFNAFYDRWRLNPAQLNGMTQPSRSPDLRPDFCSPLPENVEKQIDSDRLLDGNRFPQVILSFSVAPTFNNGSRTRSKCSLVTEQTNELLRSACTENGAQHLTIKLKQLLQDNQKFKNHLQILKDELQKIRVKPKTIKVADGVAKQNGVLFQTSPKLTNGVNGIDGFTKRPARVESPNPKTFSETPTTKLSRQSRHTVNLPHRPRARTPALGQPIKEINEINEERKPHGPLSQQIGLNGFYKRNYSPKLLFSMNPQKTFKKLSLAFEMKRPSCEFSS